ncbi:hypothetical protein MRX96_029252 [Rhipicephalus microplus]
MGPLSRGGHGARTTESCGTRNPVAASRVRHAHTHAHHRLQPLSNAVGGHRRRFISARCAGHERRAFLFGRSAPRAGEDCAASRPADSHTRTTETAAAERAATGRHSGRAATNERRRGSRPARGGRGRLTCST